MSTPVRVQEFNRANPLSSAVTSSDGHRQDRRMLLTGRFLGSTGAMGFLIGLLTVAIILVSLFMILLVLIQRGRGGGLAGAFGGMGGQSAFGTRAGDAFTRITIVFAVVWVILAGVLGIAMRNRDAAIRSGEAAPFTGGAEAEAGDEDDAPPVATADEEPAAETTPSTQPAESDEAESDAESTAPDAEAASGESASPDQPATPESTDPEAADPATGDDPPELEDPSGETPTESPAAEDPSSNL